MELEFVGNILLLYFVGFLDLCTQGLLVSMLKGII